MRYIIPFILIAFAASTTFGQKVENSAFNSMLGQLLEHNVKEVSPADINNKEAVIYLDARERSEFEVSHIKNAIWIGYDDFNLSRVADLDKHSRFVVYCSVGYRSEKITQKLQKAGFTNVANLYGGIFEWKHQLNDVFNRNGKTEKVHTYNKEWSQWLLKGIKVY